MSEQEVTKLIKLNIDNYPGRFLPNASKEQVKTMAATWWQLFKDLPAETVMNAYLRALTVCEFPVTPANIFAELRKMQSANRPSVEELWRELVRAAQKCSDEAYYFQFSTGERHRERCRKYFAALPDICRKFIGNYGRLISLGEMELEEQEHYQFPRFRRFVEQYWQDEETLCGLAALVAKTVTMIEEANCHD